MNDHPLNLAVRFILEVSGLVAIGMWGWQHEGFQKYLLAAGLPILAMLIWGIFRVPGDPGSAPVPIPGPLRLLIECLFFGAAIAALFQINSRIAIVFLMVVIVHYAISYDRILRLLR